MQHKKSKIIILSIVLITLLIVGCMKPAPPDTYEPPPEVIYEDDIAPDVYYEDLDK